MPDTPEIPEQPSQPDPSAETGSLTKTRVDEDDPEPWGTDPDVDDGPEPERPAESWFANLRVEPPAPIRSAALWCVLATGVLSGLLFGDGLAANLLIVAVPAVLAAYVTARAAGRRLRPWTLVWGIGGLALLMVPVLRDAGWPSFLAVATALGLGSLALHGCRTWPGVLLGPLGLVDSVRPTIRWGWAGLRARSGGEGGRLGPAVRAVAVAVVLLLVFGGLFAAADPAFAELLSGLTPDVSVSDGPWQIVLLVLGLLGALLAAHTAGAPSRWDHIQVGPARARSRLEWALPLIVLNLLFAAFNAVQLTVLFGGYDTVLKRTGLTPAEYARQGFWQLLFATVLTLLVIVVALRVAPRDGASDRTLVRGVLGVLCVMTLIVVASAVRRMDMYVDAYGLTRLRVSVLSMELWLGAVIVLIMAAGIWGSRLLPRAVVASGALAVLAFGLVSPDGLIAERNVQSYEQGDDLDLTYLYGLSADAVPALDALDEPLRSCAIGSIDLDSAPWYATSLGEARAHRIIEDRPLMPRDEACADIDRSDGYASVR